MSNLKLFTAHSFLDDFRNRRNVKLIWYKHRSKLEGIEYHDLIEDYDGLNETDKLYSVAYVNELYFTKHECSLLEMYLKFKHDIKLIIKEENLPICTKSKGEGNVYYPISEIVDYTNRLVFSGEKGDCLPFGVSAYYDLYDCYPSKVLPKDLRNSGVNYLKSALTMLDPKSEPNDEKLENIVNVMYQDKNYYVNWNPYKDRSILGSMSE